MTTHDTNATATPATMALTPAQARGMQIRESMTHAEARAIVPTTFAEAQAFAHSLAHSNLLPSQLQKRVEDVLMIVLAGAELSIPPVRALSMFHVIEGVPKLSADALAAIVSASPLCEYLEPREQSDTRVTWAAKRAGRPEVVLTWTHADAERAGLLRPTRSGSPSNHTRFPRQMLNARAKADLCRMVWPDVCAGLVTAEEARDMAHAAELDTPTPTAAFTAPAPLAAPAPAPSKAPAGKGGRSSKASTRSTPAVIDATATESASSASSSSSEVDSSSAPSDTSPASSPPASTSSSSPLPPDAARDAAFDRARADAAALEEDRRRRAASSAPEIEEAPPPSDADAPSSDAAADDFGEDEAASPTTARTIEKFEALVAAAVKRRDADELEAIKRDWVPWSKDEREGGGKQYAHRMRDVYARAKAELGAR